MDESAEIAPSDTIPTRPLWIMAGVAAAGMLGFLGLYQGFSLTWRNVPQLQAVAPSATMASVAQPVAPTVAAADTGAVAPVSDRGPKTADSATDAAPVQVADAAPAIVATAPANTADAAAMTPTADTPTAAPTDAPALLPPPARDDDPNLSQAPQ